jgi:hypothetical protein
MYRHEIDDIVLKFIINKFNIKFIDGNTFSYIYSDKNTRIEINKGNVKRQKEKIVVDFYNIIQEESTTDPFRPNTMSHTLSFINSDVLRNFFEQREDELNKDYIRNNSEKILKFIDTNK